MKGNPWLLGYVVFTALLMGGTGYYFVQGRAAYDEKFTGWDGLKSKIARLEKEIPFPNQKNAEALESLTQDYEKQVTTLYTSLARYQRDLNTQLSDTEFTNRVLKEKMSAFTTLAAEKNLEIEKKEEFFMGFEAYRSTFARTDLVPLLDFQLEAVNHVLKHLAESGAEQLKSVTREPLPGEAVAPVPASGADSQSPATPAEVVQKFPLQVRFVSDHRAFVEFVNRIANDKEFFLVLRALRVDNSQPEGPAIGAGADPNEITWKKPDGQIATEAQQQDKGKGTLSPADFNKAMEDDGWVQQRQDARILFGKEKLEVVAVIDVVRFLPPSQTPSPAETDAAGTKGKGKTASK